MPDHLTILRRLGLEPGDLDALRREASARAWRHQLTLQRVLGESVPWHLRRYGWRRVPCRPGAP